MAKIEVSLFVRSQGEVLEERIVTHPEDISDSLAQKKGDSGKDGK